MDYVKVRVLLDGTNDTRLATFVEFHTILNDEPRGRLIESGAHGVYLNSKGSLILKSLLEEATNKKLKKEKKE